ncbi:condensation domain-containing protein [Streptosporangium subroseum]|uniref:condensation domain-containing protein n=1 Tax=Streptosporangium subroseum TaxID=106412 RepID=UPI003429635B
MSHASFDLRGIPLVLHLNGPVDIPALLSACAAVAARHSVLGRVRVTRMETSPERYPEVATAAAARPFDLDRGPLARFTLVTVGQDRNRLIFTAHGRVFDASSKDILVRDLADAYFSRAALPRLPLPYGEPPAPRGDLPVRRGEPAEPPAESSTGPDGTAELPVEPAGPVRPAAGFSAGTAVAEAFWRERVGESAELVLPGLRANPHGVGPGEIVEMVLGRAEFEGFAAAATALGATRFELLLASLGALLRGYGTVGSPIALDLGTRTGETRDHIGPFVAEVPFVPHPGPDEDLPAYLRTVQAELRALYRFRHLPPERTLRPVLFSYRRRAATPRFHGVGTGVEWTVFNGVARGALHIQAVDADRSLTLGLRFNPAAIDHDDVSQIARYLRTLLRAIAAEPRARIAELPAPIHPEPDEESVAAGLPVHREPGEESVAAGLPVRPEPGEESVAVGPLSSDGTEGHVMTQMREIWQEILSPVTANAF